MTNRPQSTDPSKPRPTELAPPNPYAVPLVTLVAGAYVAVTEHVQLQPTSTFQADVDAGFGLGGGGGDGDGE